MGRAETKLSMGSRSLIYIKMPPRNPDIQAIPLCRENPKIGRVYDAEVVSDRIAEHRPVFLYLLAQEM
jgi:hypothetical protein